TARACATARPTGRTSADRDRVARAAREEGDLFGEHGSAAATAADLIGDASGQSGGSTSAARTAAAEWKALVVARERTGPRRACREGDRGELHPDHVPRPRRRVDEFEVVAVGDEKRVGVRSADRVRVVW